MLPVRHIALSARQILGLALVTVIAALMFMAASPASSLAAPPVALSGAYDGAGNPTGLNQLGTWRGAKEAIALDYLANDKWTDISQDTWLQGQWKPYQATGGKLVLSVPLLVSSQPGTFAAGAQGSYDRYFEALGQQLVANGDGNIVLRMGWEFNGNWFPWSLSSSNPAMSPAAFVAYWRHLVNLFRAIPGANFKFDWTVNSGPSSIPASSAYPGDAYVDYVGIDLYDSSWAPTGGTVTDPAARWNQQANQEYGLNWWNTFAKSHNKQLSIPEWGLNNNTAAGSNGAGDDPSYILNMYNWMKANQPAYEMYFNADGTVLNVPDDPNASAEYQKLWGDSAPADTSTSATAQPAVTTSAAASTHNASGKSVKSIANPTKTTRATRAATKGRSAHKLARTDALIAHSHKSAKAKAKPATKAKARRLAQAKHLRDRKYGLR